MSLPLTAIENIIDTSGAAPMIKGLLPAAVRARQLTPRTLLIGMHLALADGRPAHLTRVHAALTGLPEHDQKRLGVIEDWKTRPHQLTYRQVEHTSPLLTRALARTEPDGAPSPNLQQLCDQLLEASIPGAFKDASTSLAVDWTDVEAWSRPVPADRPGSGADPRPAGGTATSTARSRKEKCSTATTSCATRRRFTEWGWKTLVVGPSQRLE